ncbi:MAG TPA: hypothetical protein VIJ85_08755 [Rhizomicrobium sp.]
MNDDDDTGRLTAREWIAARLVIVGGFVVAILVAGYFTWQQHLQTQDLANAQMQATAQQAAAQAIQQTTSQSIARASLILCLRELVNAQTMGIIPAFGKLVSQMPEPGASRGRYSCMAGTDVAKYKITGDLVCRQLQKAECVKIVSIASDDGTVLYQNPK